MKKRTLYAEAAYLLGIVILALGTALMEKAAFGMSMVVSPAYILHVKISEFLPFFTFGMAEYTFQAFLLVILCIVKRKFRMIFLFSFVTAVIYGFTLDGIMLLCSGLPADGIVWRILWYILGMVICSMGVALLFHTYIAPEAYELFVKVIAVDHGWEISRVKTVYDCVSCAVSVILSFVFFGFGTFVGVNWGTVVCALINGSIIGACTALLKKCFTFADALPWREYFS
ncbi:MAG: hypothetical protein IJ334_02565 [Clostridia bacterium]|nr:hypothetical protein [Clostridia bacterium]